jgi:hypothetical protein
MLLMCCIQTYQLSRLPIKKRCSMKMKMRRLHSMMSSLERVMLTCFSWGWSKIKGLISFSSFSSNANSYKSLWLRSRLTFLLINRNAQMVIGLDKSKHLTLLSDTRKSLSLIISTHAARWTAHVRSNAWLRARVCCDLTPRSRTSTDYFIIRLTLLTNTMSQDQEST